MEKIITLLLTFKILANFTGKHEIKMWRTWLEENPQYWISNKIRQINAGTDSQGGFTCCNLFFVAKIKHILSTNGNTLMYITT